ncbi:hypothetical protein U3516DRAFT_744799 [Neocallimastix sp. 'constans']
MRFIYSEYSTIKYQIRRNINKQLSPDITIFDEISDESKYYETIRNENFIIFKNPNLIIFKLINQYFN